MPEPTREEILAVLEPFARVGNAWGSDVFDYTITPNVAEWKSAAALHARLSQPVAEPICANCKPLAPYGCDPFWDAATQKEERR